MTDLKHSQAGPTMLDSTSHTDCDYRYVFGVLSRLRQRSMPVVQGLSIQIIDMCLASMQGPGQQRNIIMRTSVPVTWPERRAYWFTHSNHAYRVTLARPRSKQGLPLDRRSSYWTPGLLSSASRARSQLLAPTREVLPPTQSQPRRGYKVWRNNKRFGEPLVYCAGTVGLGARTDPTTHHQSRGLAPPLTPGSANL